LKKLKKITLTALISLLLLLFFSNLKLYSIEKKDSVVEYSQLFYQAEQFRMKGEFKK